jgi:hypothetical protein
MTISERQRQAALKAHRTILLKKARAAATKSEAQSLRAKAGQYTKLLKAA